LFASQEKYGGALRFNAAAHWRDAATGEALRAVVDFDLDELAAIAPPRGFGRD
jgi:hypothetical protein